MSYAEVLAKLASVLPFHQTTQYTPLPLLSLPPPSLCPSQQPPSLPLPSSIQFTTFISSVESLFGLLNGDDIYNTYIQINEQVDILAYVYSRIFLYLFLALFIYAVLNLFTSLIIAAYEISQVMTYCLSCDMVLVSIVDHVMGHVMLTSYLRTRTLL